MKRSAFPFLIAAIIAVVLAFSAQHDPSLESGPFESQFRAAVHRSDFAVLAEAAAPTDDVPLPLTILWHPRRWRTMPEAQAIPDSVDRFSLARQGESRLECFVRYLGGRAQIIDIRADRNGASDAAKLRQVLREQFPGFPVRLQTQ